jgi:hypothetical protein
MVIASDPDRHAARTAPPAAGADDGTVTGFDGTPAGVVVFGAVAPGAVVIGVVAPGVVAPGAVAAGAEVGTAGCPVAAGGSPPPAGWLGLGEPQATSTNDAATAAPASSAALGDANDGLGKDLDMGVILPCSR